MLSDPIVQIPLFAAVAFIILAHPRTFGFVDDKLGPLLRVDIATDSDRPTRAGLIVHAAVMFLVVFGFLKAYDVVSGGSGTFGSLY
jgi:hypothetical protein